MISLSWDELFKPYRIAPRLCQHITSRYSPWFLDLSVLRNKPHLSLSRQTKASRRSSGRGRGERERERGRGHVRCTVQAGRKTSTSRCSRDRHHRSACSGPGRSILVVWRRPSRPALPPSRSAPPPLSPSILPSRCFGGHRARQQSGSGSV